MSHKLKSNISNDVAPCEKYLSKLMRQESSMASRKSQPPRFVHEKSANISRQSSITTPRPKPKFNVRQQSPIQKITAQMIGTLQKQPTEEQSPRGKRTSPNRTRSGGAAGEVWGSILYNNKSREKVSSFSNFDPLRTLHFLSQELSLKLQEVAPDNNEVLEMVTDMQHALKRIPPEVTAVVSPDNKDSTVSAYKSVKTCQTPPTMYQEDTEKFQKIMEENTYRLEASCQQLEKVCTNLQKEKEMTEKELDETRTHVQLLCQKVKDLEDEIDEMSEIKIKQLEKEKEHLQEKLNAALQEVNDNPTLNQLKNLVEDLKAQKANSDDTCRRLQYDMVLLKMEKEKFVTMLSVRDKEIKEIQDEMSKIQEQVAKQLKNLNSETVERVNSVRSLSEKFDGLAENVFLEIGDTTISSISNESEKLVIKESSCGDARLTGMTRESQDDLRFQNDNGDMDLARKDEDEAFQQLLTRLTPSIQAMLSSTPM